MLFNCSLLVESKFLQDLLGLRQSLVPVESQINTISCIFPYRRSIFSGLVCKMKQIKSCLQKCHTFCNMIRSCD